MITSLLFDAKLAIKIHLCKCCHDHGVGVALAASFQVEAFGGHGNKRVFCHILRVDDNAVAGHAAIVESLGVDDIE